MRQARILAALYFILTISPAISDMTDSIEMMWGNTQVLYDSYGHQNVTDPWPVDDFGVPLQEPVPLWEVWHW